MKIMIRSLTILAMITLATAAIITRPRYIDCIDSLECAVGTCCTVGQGKYSIPKCLPVLERGEECRVGSEFPTNATLSYPDGQTVHATGIYITKCPCAHGLYCSHASGVCEDPFEEFKYNDLDNENDVEPPQ